MLDTSHRGNARLFFRQMLTHARAAATPDNPAMSKTNGCNWSAATSLPDCTREKTRV